MKNVTRGACATSLLIAGILLAGAAQSDEVCGKVIKVGQCWSGFHAVVVEMDNGDKLFLGNLADELTKARLSIALTSSASDKPICYQKNPTQLICSAQRAAAEWWILGGGLY